MLKRKQISSLWDRALKKMFSEHF